MKKIVFSGLALAVGLSVSGAANGSAGNEKFGHPALIKGTGAPEAGKMAAQEADKNSGLPLQRIAGGHVIGFGPREVIFGGGDHALRVEFVGSRGVTPESSENAPSTGTKIPSLGTVIYRDLWPGIALTYRGENAGVAKSVWTVAPGAAAGAIRLRANAQVRTDEQGNLVYAFPKGTMRESKPVAWQEIRGKRVPVEVTYRLDGEREFGYTAPVRDARYPLIIDPVLSWDTVIGGTGNDSSSAIALDSSGNIYVVGQSDASWGTPVRPFSGNDDVFVAKLSPNGTLLWNTFLGGSAYDTGFRVGLDAGGNIYVSGQSEGTWGSPIRAFSAGIDEFVAKLSPYGALLWNTFLGGAGYDCDGSMAVDQSGNCYVAGWSDASWGTPVRPFNAVPAGYKDMSIAKVGNSGSLIWNTFLGGTGYDNAGGVALDGSGGLDVAGSSESSWGAPINAYAAASDIAVARINASDGALQWNTFLGGAGYDYASGITVSPQGLLLIAGSSDATWGSPVNAYAGGYSDGTVVVLDANGNLLWSTFLGGSGDDDCASVAVSGTGAIYVVGSSSAGWGSPDRPFSGNTDGFVARLNTAGRLQALTFVGGVDYDWGDALAMDNNRNVYVAGTTATNYIPPDRPQAASFDSFVCRLTFIPDVLNRAAVGNFDNNGVMAAVMNFPGLGVWKYSAGAWTQVSPNYAEELVAADVDGDGVDEVVGDFGATGLWLRQGGAWTQLSSYDVEELAVDDIDVDNRDELFCDFGALGIWVLDSGVWLQVGGANPSHIAVKHGIAPDLTAQNILVADFGALGLWWRIVFNQYGVPAGSWSDLTGADADFFVVGDLVADNRIACDFGGLGLWLAEGSGWTQLSGLDSNYLIMADLDWDQVNEIVGDFGAVGLWLWNSGTWSQLSGQREEFMIAADANGDLHKELFVDFGSVGLWEYGSGTWTQLSGVNPEYIISGDFDGDFQAELMVDFGALGLWVWNYGTWTQLTGVNPS